LGLSLEEEEATVDAAADVSCKDVGRRRGRYSCMFRNDVTLGTVLPPITDLCSWCETG
jgi:hypothetical protein